MSPKLPVRVAGHCLELIQEVGETLLRFQKRANSLTIISKDVQGIASTADYEAESMILKRLKKLYPHIAFLAEESAYTNSSSLDQGYEKTLQQEWLWIIDPLDGTNNFLNGLSYFGISLALCYKGKVVLGLIHHPHSGDTLLAQTEKKTQLISKNSGRKKTVYIEKNTKTLSTALLATGFVSEKEGPNLQEFEVFRQMMMKSRGLRRMGSASLDLCGVARGHFDGFWERGLPPWDLAAASLICQNSGVLVRNLHGGPYKLGDSGIIAARNPLVRQLCQALSPLAAV